MTVRKSRFRMLAIAFSIPSRLRFRWSEGQGLMREVHE